MKGSLALIPLLIAFSLPILAQKTADLERKPHALLSEQQKRPNIVVVLVDDMRWDEYGEAGHNFIKTPNIDRLAKEGAAFPNAFATTPLCSPGLTHHDFFK